jgi:O-antigen/teichoic acid export membrane protein
VEAAEPAHRSGAELGRLARGGVLNLVAAAITGLANLVLIILVTRGFSPAVAGVFFAVTTVFLLAVRLTELGVNTGLVYFLARFRALGQADRIRPLLRVAYPPVLVASVLGGAVLFAFAPTWATLAVKGDPGAFSTLLRILAVFLPLAVVSDTCLAATRGYGLMRPTALIEKVARPLGQLALIGIAILVGSGSALTLAWVAPYAGTALAAWAWFAAIRSRRAAALESAAEPEPVGTRAMAREFWRFTVPRAATDVVQLALQRFDIVLIAALRGPRDAAIYAAVTRFLVVGQLVNQALTQVVEPKLSELIGKGDHAASRTVYQTSTCWIVLLNWPFYLSFAVCAPLVLQLFGPAYQAGRSVALILGGAMLVASACGMVGTLLNMAGRTTWNLGNAVLALTVNVSLDLVLIPRYGIIGAAFGWAAAIVTMNLLPLTQIGFSLGLHPLGRGTRLAIVLSAGCFGVLPFAVSLVAGRGVVPLLAALAAGAVSYLGLCWRFRERFDLDALRALRRRRPTPTADGGAR